jgi:hypothetical protein
MDCWKILVCWKGLLLLAWDLNRRQAKAESVKQTDEKMWIKTRA